MRFPSVLIVLFLLVSFPVYAATIELTEKDNGAVLKLQPGDQVAVRLSGNPTTGYTWELAAVSVDILEPGLEPEFARDSELIGVGGRYTFRFTARNRGYARVILAYLRTWEKEAPPVKTFEITVDVNSSREKKPVTTVNYVSESRAILTASFDPNTNEVRVTLPDKQVINLPLAISASGVRYSNGYETFWEHHGNCTYTKGGKVVFEGTDSFQ